MERVGSREPALIKALIKDAYVEMESLAPLTTGGSKISVISGTRDYALPAEMIDLLGVYQKYDENGKYIAIPEIVNLDFIDGITDPVIVVV